MVATDKETKKALREQYAQRHPDMGIACWRSGADIWYSVTTDANAEHNRTLFQLQLGSWPNRELQQRYTAAPESFAFALEKKLDYEELSDDHSDDLELLRLEYIEEHPEARPMRPGRK